MTDLIPQLLVAVTALIGLIGAWLKFRAESKNSPDQPDLAMELRDRVRNDPSQFGLGPSLKASLIGGAAAAATVEVVHASAHLLADGHQAATGLLADGLADLL